MPSNEHVTYLIAELETGYESLVTYLRDLAVSLGLPDPLPDLPSMVSSIPGGPEQELSSHVLYYRTSYTPLLAFPSVLRPTGISSANKSLGLTLIIRRAIYTEIIDPGVPPSVPPTILTVDRGLEAEIIRYCGPGEPWDVMQMPDIITASIESYNLEADVQTIHNDVIQCPALPIGWVRVFPEHASLVYAKWEPPTAAVGPIDPPVSPL